MNQKLNYQLNQDGSVSLSCGDTCLVPEIFPGIDGGSIKPLKTELLMDGKGVEWLTVDGKIRMQISDVQENGFGIRYTLEEYTRPIVAFWVLNRNFAEQMQGMFQAGEGMAEVTRFLGKERITEKRRVRSFGLTSLQFVEGSLTIYADDHSNYPELFTAT